MCGCVAQALGILIHVLPNTVLDLHDSTLRECASGNTLMQCDGRANLRNVTIEDCVSYSLESRFDIIDDPGSVVRSSFYVNTNGQFYAHDLRMSNVSCESAHCTTHMIGSLGGAFLDIVILEISLTCEQISWYASTPLVAASVFAAVRGLRLQALPGCEVPAFLSPTSLIDDINAFVPASCSPTSCGSGASCSLAAVLPVPIGPPPYSFTLTTSICSCVEPNIAFPGVDPALSAFIDGCAMPRQAHFIEQTRQATSSSSLTVQLQRTAKGGEAVEERTLRLVMKGSAPSRATWTIDPAAVPAWLTTPLAGTVGPTKKSVEWRVTLHSRGLPENEAPYTANLPVRVISDINETIVVPVYLFVRSEPGLRPCDKGFMFADGMCTRCLEGTTCLVDTLLDNVSLHPGFWRLSNLSQTLYSCRKTRRATSACIGGTYAGVLGEGYCMENHLGVGCEACISGYYFKSEESRCVSCPPAARAFGVPIGILLGLLLVGLGVWSVSRFEALRMARFELKRCSSNLRV